MLNFKGKNILITGGSGTLGLALAEYILLNYPELESLVIFSRDE